MPLLRQRESVMRGGASRWSPLTTAKLPACGKEANVGAGLLVVTNFGAVDMKLIYMNGFYSTDSIAAPTGSTIAVKTSFRLWRQTKLRVQRERFIRRELTRPTTNDQ
jgi:hypothetical protein